AYGWAVVRSGLETNAAAGLDVDELDEQMAKADAQLFTALESYLADLRPPDLDWHFRRALNNDRGILLFSSSRNHRETKPTALALLEWLAHHGPGSRGVVFLHDDEDERGGGDYANRYRVWRLLKGVVEELDDPILTAIRPEES